MTKTRTNFRVGPFQFTGSATLGIVLAVVAFLACCVLPCIVGSLAL